MLKTATLRFQSILSMVGLAILAAFLGLFMTSANYDWQGLLVIGGGLGIISIFLLPRMARVEGDYILKILVFALLLKFVFSMVNYYFAFSVYGGTADANGYNRTGALIAEYIRHFEFSKVVPYLQWGTDFIHFFTGVIYAITGTSIFGGFLVYAFLSFLGSYYFYRAFRIAFPEGNKWLFAGLVFFFPSILYWPSAIGKDAVMFLCLGLFAYGGSQLIQDRRQGLIPLGLGFLGALWIRPHIATISIVAFAFAFFLPGSRKQHFRPATYIVGLIAVVALAWFLLPKVMAFLNLSELSPNQIIGFMQQYQGYSSQSGASFQAINLNNPLTYLMTPINLLFRPFLWEAHNIQAIVESLEGVFLLCLAAWRITFLGRAVASSTSNTYSRYVLIYIVAFVIIFAAIVNFGTLARERVMLQPFFFMLICYGPSKLMEKQKQPAGTI
jgi:hypothetical protein